MCAVLLFCQVITLWNCFRPWILCHSYCCIICLCELDCCTNVYIQQSGSVVVLTIKVYVNTASNFERYKRYDSGIESNVFVLLQILLSFIEIQYSILVNWIDHQITFNFI